MAWTLLRNQDDLTEFRRNAETQSQLPYTWGPLPSKYPCMVSSVRLSIDRTISAYVYLDDARGLVDYVDRQTGPVTPNQAQFNRWVAAQTLAIVHYMVETGICKKDQFEAKLQSCLEVVDAHRSGEQIDPLLDRMCAIDP